MDIILNQDIIKDNKKALYYGELYMGEQKMLFDKFINREPLDHKVLGDLALELGEYDKALNHYKKEEYNYFNTEDDNYINMDDIGGTYL